VKIGVSGVGSIGLRHLRLLSERPDVRVYAYDATPRALPAAVTACDSFAALLDAGLDGLVVATPDPAHAPQTIAACQRGIRVLVEKPVADSVTAAGQVAAVTAQTGVPVLVGYVLRHYEVVRQVRTLLADGAVGTPVSAQVSLGAYETLRLARNRFSPTDRYRLPYDYSHEWDYLQWFLGPIVRACAVARQAGDLPLTQDPNVVDGLLVLESGLTATFHLDYVQDGGGRRLQVVGDRGTLRADLAGGLVRLRRHGESLTREYDCREPRDAAFDRQLSHFLDVVAARTEPVVTVQDGLRALAVADAVVAACESGTWADVIAVGA
jgi:predicted dehydrogenase